jgi:ferric-dicitrate binding protein FerR (iron transport regulator)
MTMLEHNCKEIHRIWRDRDAGKPTPLDEQDLVSAHLSQCEMCRLEDKAMEHLRFDVSASGAPAIDDLSTRRRIDDVLERAWVRDLPAIPRRRSLVASFVAIAAAAVVAIVAVWGVMERPVTTPVADVQVATENRPSAVDGKIVLLSSDATVSGGGENMVNQIASKTRVVAGKGTAILNLDTDITVLLSPETEVEVRRLDTTGIELFLERGHLLASVEPARDGPGLAISTTDGRVVVTGTVFSVDVKKGDVTAKVYRGKVRLEENNSEDRRLRAGQLAVLGTQGVTAVADEDRIRTQKLLKTLDLLSPTQGASMEIDSVPSGALVIVDDVLLGQTPLVVSITPGHRMLELEMDGYAPVKEFIDLGVRDDLSRTFELTKERLNVVSNEKNVSPTGTVNRRGEVAVQTPEGLLAQAQAMRAAHNWSGASKTYARLLQKYPTSAEARSSLVSHGNLLLDRMGKPARALDLFNKYLASSNRGTLAQEAAYGRAVAFRAIGDARSESGALKSFIKSFPSAIEVSMARLRLEEIENRSF